MDVATCGTAPCGTQGVQTGVLTGRWTPDDMIDENFLVELMVALRRVDTYTYDRLRCCFIIPEMTKKDMLALLDILIKHDARFELNKHGLVIYVQQ